MTTTTTIAARVILATKEGKQKVDVTSTATQAANYLSGKIDADKMVDILTAKAIKKMEKAGDYCLADSIRDSMVDAIATPGKVVVDNNVELMNYVFMTVREYAAMGVMVRVNKKVTTTLTWNDDMYDEDEL